MKKDLLTTSIISIIILILASLSIFSGCAEGNSGNLSDGFTNESNTFNYILTSEAGDFYLHEINLWFDSESDALGATTKCCENRFWTSYNEAVLYQNRPRYLPDYVIICGE